jgi:hypothetical protein
MQPRLPICLRVPNPLLQNPLRLLYILPVQIDRVGIHRARRVVLAEYVIRRLLVIRLHLRGVFLPLLGQLVRCSAIASLVCLMGLVMC